MEAVLADPDLLPLVLWAIKDPDPEVAGRALDSWVMTSRAIHNACRADLDQAWMVLLDSAFGEWLDINAGELAVSFAKAGEHPRIYLKELSAVTRWYRMYTADFMGRWPGRRPSLPSAYAYFVRGKQREYEAEKHAAKAHAASLGMANTEYEQSFAFFHWVKRRWGWLPQWRRDVYFACYRVEKARLKREAAGR